MYRPRPRPRLPLTPTCQNRSKMLSSKWGGMPTPVSVRLSSAACRSA